MSTGPRLQGNWQWVGQQHAAGHPGCVAAPATGGRVFHTAVRLTLGAARPVHRNTWWLWSGIQTSRGGVSTPSIGVSCLLEAILVTHLCGVKGRAEVDVVGATGDVVAVEQVFHQQAQTMPVGNCPDMIGRRRPPLSMPVLTCLVLMTRGYNVCSAAPYSIGGFAIQNRCVSGENWDIVKGDPARIHQVAGHVGLHAPLV